MPAEKEIHAWLALSRHGKIGAAKLKKILPFFGSVADFWAADPAAWRASGLDEKTGAELAVARREIDPETEAARLAAAGADALILTDERYPESLKQIHQPPIVLYFRGHLENLSTRALAVVGTRLSTAYGALVIDRLLPPLIHQDLAIVSGLALGTDTLAHLCALAHGGRTYAVLGSGIDEANIYPGANRALAKRIAENHGLVLSEFPPGTRSERHHFPMRNRIIAGLSLGTLVIEAPTVSGALITARFALDQNREVFAVPGPIHAETSAGTNALINQGAKLTATAEDILEELNLRRLAAETVTAEPPTLSPEQTLILRTLAGEAKHINEIIKQTLLTASEANAALTILELQGLVRNLGGMTYLALR